jgi:hypothetical protein
LMKMNPSLGIRYPTTTAVWKWVKHFLSLPLSVSLNRSTTQPFHPARNLGAMFNCTICPTCPAHADPISCFLKLFLP